MQCDICKVMQHDIIQNNMTPDCITYLQGDDMQIV